MGNANCACAEVRTIDTQEAVPPPLFDAKQVLDHDEPVKQIESKKAAESNSILGAVSVAVEAVQEAVHIAVEKVEAAILPETKEAPAAPVKDVAPVAPKPVTPVVITFEKAGKAFDVKFVSRPLGISYDHEKKRAVCGTANTGNFVVTNIANKPELKKVEKGMVIRKVGGKDVPSKVSIAELNAFMKKQVATLPEITFEAAVPKA